MVGPADPIGMLIESPIRWLILALFILIALAIAGDYFVNVLFR